MSKSDEQAGLRGDDLRRSRLLESAVETFVRFGFRKTSMEELAQAAGISRQGLYLHFATKEELFQAAVRHAFVTSMATVVEQLQGEQTIEQKLTGALDIWFGRFVGMHGDNMTDLYEATQQFVGAIIAEHEEAFLSALTKLMRSSGLSGAYRVAGISARQLAETLCATARGLKHTCATRAEFRDRIAIAVRAMSLPLR
jgi:AcrR family transcriptional regulator